MRGEYSGRVVHDTLDFISYMSRFKHDFLPLLAIRILNPAYSDCSPRGVKIGLEGMMTIVSKTHAQKLSSLIKGCQNNILPGYSISVRDCHDTDMMPEPVGVRLNYTR